MNRSSIPSAELLIPTGFLIQPTVEKFLKTRSCIHPQYLLRYRLSAAPSPTGIRANVGTRFNYTGTGSIAGGGNELGGGNGREACILLLKACDVQDSTYLHTMPCSFAHSFHWYILHDTFICAFLKYIHLNWRYPSYVNAFCTVFQLTPKIILHSFVDEAFVYLRRHANDYFALVFDRSHAWCKSCYSAVVFAVSAVYPLCLFVTY